MYVGIMKSAFVCDATRQYFIRAADSNGPGWPMNPLQKWKPAPAYVIDLGGLRRARAFYSVTPGRYQTQSLTS